MFCDRHSFSLQQRFRCRDIAAGSCSQSCTAKTSKQPQRTIRPRFVQFGGYVGSPWHTARAHRRSTRRPFSDCHAASTDNNGSLVPPDPYSTV